MEIQKILITYNFILIIYTPITVPFKQLYALGKYHRYKLLIKQYQSYNAKKGLSRQQIGVTLCHAYSVILSRASSCLRTPTFTYALKRVNESSPYRSSCPMSQWQVLSRVRKSGLGGTAGSLESPSPPQVSSRRPVVSHTLEASVSS